MKKEKLTISLHIGLFFVKNDRKEKDDILSCGQFIKNLMIKTLKQY